MYNKMFLCPLRLSLAGVFDHRVRLSGAAGPAGLPAADRSSEDSA